MLVQFREHVLPHRRCLYFVCFSMCISIYLHHITPSCMFILNYTYVAYDTYIYIYCTYCKHKYSASIQRVQFLDMTYIQFHIIELIHNSFRWASYHFASITCHPVFTETPTGRVRSSQRRAIMWSCGLSIAFVGLVERI